MLKIYSSFCRYVQASTSKLPLIGSLWPLFQEKISDKVMLEQIHNKEGHRVVTATPSEAQRLANQNIKRLFKESASTTRK